MAQESWKLEQEDPALSPSPPDARGPCSNNCGFFGSSSTMNLCSSCYLNLLTSKASVAAGAASSGADISLSPTPSRPASPSSELLLPAVPASTSLPFQQQQQQQQQKQTPSRCLTCRKRVGLMGFKCRCGDVFCSLHRYSDKHNCSFDYKAAARAAILKANPVVKADKIEKI